MASKVRNRSDKKRVLRFKKKMRVRKKISGTTLRPRFSIFKSNSHLYAQIIDDTVGKTLVACATSDSDIAGRCNRKGAKAIGETVAKKALAKNISNVVFDRNGYQYHGRIKELADAARSAGLQF